MDAEHVAQTDQTQTLEDPSSRRIRRWIELLSAVLMAAATVATAWSAYQSARWSGTGSSHEFRSLDAMVQASKFRNLAEQKLNLHVGLFAQWAAAYAASDTTLANFAFDRFPEPLKSAAIAWQATRPLSNPAAPRSPFDMPEYALAETAEAQKWEETSLAESAAAERAGMISGRYLLFTVIFAAVLFFAGISGKFTWPVINEAVLALGGLVLIIGLAIMFTLPIV